MPRRRPDRDSPPKPPSSSPTPDREPPGGPTPNQSPVGTRTPTHGGRVRSTTSEPMVERGPWAEGLARGPELRTEVGDVVLWESGVREVARNSQNSSRNGSIGVRVLHSPTRDPRRPSFRRDARGEASRPLNVVSVPKIEPMDDPIPLACRLFGQDSRHSYHDPSLRLRPFG